MAKTPEQRAKGQRTISLDKPTRAAMDYLTKHYGLATPPISKISQQAIQTHAKSLGWKGEEDG